MKRTKASILLFFFLFTLTGNATVVHTCHGDVTNVTLTGRSTCEMACHEQENEEKHACEKDDDHEAEHDCGACDDCEDCDECCEFEQLLDISSDILMAHSPVKDDVHDPNEVIIPTRVKGEIRDKSRPIYHRPYKDLDRLSLFQTYLI